MQYENVLTICIYCGCGCAINLQVLDREIDWRLEIRPGLIGRAGAIFVSRAGWKATGLRAVCVYNRERLGPLNSPTPLMQRYHPLQRFSGSKWANDPEIRRSTCDVLPMSEAGADAFMTSIPEDEFRQLYREGHRWSG